jgi:IS5 family transposase
MFACPATDDFFRSRIDHMIDLRHPLVVLASRMPWQEIEARVAQVFSRKGRAGVAMPDLDLFGEQVQRVAVASNAGRPRVSLRTMIALLYLKHAFNESDEGVVERWADTPRWQFFSGCARTTKTASPATPPPWSSSSSCWAKKGWRSRWHRPSTWPSISSRSSRRS